MKKICIYLMILISSSSFGQVNLIQNGDFEQYYQCPTYFNQVPYCVGWSSASDSTLNNQTPDYFNSCNPVSYLSPPTVLCGFQSPHSGNGYCGIATYFKPSGVNQNVREYIQDSLIDSLTLNLKYYVSFYANLSGESIYTCASNKIGVLFTMQKFEAPNFASPLNFAHVYTDTVITDTAGWFHFKGTFIADSAYHYMTLGNFFDDSNTDTINLDGSNSFIGYYYIDDVCVSTDSNLCYTKTAFEEILPVLPNVYPNPANGIIDIVMDNSKMNDVIIYDPLGNIFKQLKKVIGSVTLDCSYWSEGLYFLKLNNTVFKIIIKH